jgi:hypothetical protein
VAKAVKAVNVVVAVAVIVIGNNAQSARKAMS